MATFLSDEWFEALARALALAPASSADFALGQVVTGAPGGERRYTIAFATGSAPTVHIGSTEAAGVTLAEDYESAAALASGATGIADLLMRGRIRIHGDIGLLVRHQELIVDAGRALASLETEF